MSKSWATGSTSAWRRIRRQVLEDANYACQIKGSKCSHVATQAHHTLGREVTGDDRAFLVASCQPCNRQVGKPSGDPKPRSNTTAW